MSKTKIIMTSAATALIVIITAVATFPSIPGMFRLNKELQEQGYYMAEFEFKMVGIVYNLDKGHYLKALKQLYTYNNQLKTKKGLIKLPAFADKKEEMAFYLDLQNPRTGAFMDDSFPFCTFTGPTGNVLNHLDQLAVETSQPLKLKYPLSYLDRINTPEKLNEYFDDISKIGWLGTQFPQSSFHFTRCLLSLFHEDNVIDKYHLYDASPEWKHALLEWFYRNQDPASGCWGPRYADGKLRKIDTMNTSSIMKAFIDENGHDRYREFPLRYRDALAKTYLDKKIFNIPSDASLDEWHEWDLDSSKKIKLIMKLWDGLSDETKNASKEIIRYYIRIRFEKFYVGKEGAFSNYPNSDHATLDGSGGMIGIFNRLGAFSSSQLRRFNGNRTVQITSYSIVRTSDISPAHIEQLTRSDAVNSIRCYSALPVSDKYTENVVAVFYPKNTPIRDVMELIPKMKRWIGSTNQSMGNWTSREQIASDLSAIRIKTVPVFEGNLSLNQLNTLYRTGNRLVLIGFDELQTPVCSLVIER